MYFYLRIIILLNKERNDVYIVSVINNLFFKIYISIYVLLFV